MSLHIHLQQLRIIDERLASVRNRAGNCADAFTGSLPPATKAKPEHISSHTLNNQFAEIITEIQSKIEGILNEIGRIEDQVLDSPVSASGAIYDAARS